MPSASETSVETLKAEAERNGWKLDIWPANHIDPYGRARLRIGRAELVVDGYEVEEMCSEILAALSAIEVAADA